MMRMKSEYLQGMSPFCRSMSDAKILRNMVMMMMMVITQKRVMVNMMMKSNDEGGQGRISFYWDKEGARV